MSKFLKRIIAVFAITVVGKYQQVTAQSQPENNPISKISISSPTAASLGKFGDIPVNYHTGIPKVDIPIYTVSAGPLSLPISLSYHASGLKVQEPASWVGAGWSLNAGGVITRSVVGAPDEKGTNNGGIETHGHFSDYGYNNYIWNSTIGGPPYPGGEDWVEVSRGGKDAEPDLFFFNFGGYSGKFYFRDDRTPVVVPEADFKIEPYYSPSGIIKSIQSFIITTSDGTKYYFGQTPGLTGTPPIEITNPMTAGNGLSSANVYSSWYLHKISTTDEQFSINLTYETEDYGFHTLSMFPISPTPPSNPQNSFGPTHGYELIKNIVHGVRLSQIIFPGGKVNFSTEGQPARTDLCGLNTAYYYDNVNQNAKPLGSIQITDGAAVVKKFNFNYSYFEDNTTPLPQDIANFAPNLFTDKKRLKLNGIQEVSGDNSLSKPPYSFTYFNEQVPRRLSFAIDHWGFNNGVTTNTGLIPSHTVIQSNQTIYNSGADRDSYWPAMRCGTLQQINYPTGGYSLFEFEPNTVYNTNTNYVNVPLSNLTVHLYGQNTYTNSSIFTSNGTVMNLSISNTTNYPAVFTITDNTNTVVHTQSIPEFGSNNFILPIYPQGTYTARLTINNNINQGGAQSLLTQWQSVITTNDVVVGGNRIKKITHNDGVTTNDMITNYDYNADNGHTSCILYSRPAYVGIIRNDFIRDHGLWQGGTRGFEPIIFTGNGCVCVWYNACYFKSTCSIRPMATTQGNPLGYSQVKVSQTNNGYSIYKYNGPTGVPPWQVNSGDVAIRTVTTTGCDNNAPSFPYAPQPYDFLRGELNYEAHYNEANQILKEKNYSNLYINNPIKTPGFIATSPGENMGVLITKYELTTARKTQTTVTETDYDPATNTSLTTTNTSYYESPFHNEVTRTSIANSKNEIVETKKKYVFDFRLSTCESIGDGYSQYTTDCVACSTNRNAAIAACGYNNPQCTSIAQLNYMHCLNIARSNWVTYRRTNFTDPVNTFKTYHDNAKASADTELKPILQLQDDYQNSAIETTKWKNGNLLGATFSRFDYSASPAGKLYINKVQAINLNAGSSTFTNAASNTNNNGLIKDSRYQDESFVKFHNGNLAELTAKDGITTSYIWGYNNTLPVVKSIGVPHNTLLSAYNAVNGNLSQLRSQPSLSGAQLNTYVYTPITGMTAETDVNGKTMTYEYDALQRLLLVRDFNNNIIKQYDYKYQVMPPSGIAQWIATGATRCKPCPQNPIYLSNILQQEEKDNNPQSATYNTIRWTDVGTSSGCVSNPDWQNTSLPVRCRISHFTQQNTGEQEQQQIDMNPCSSSYGQTRWIVVGVNYTICPVPYSCNSGNCAGNDKKCINNNCETGTKLYTGSYYSGKTGQWMCIYHYHWSDGSDSINYQEVSTGQCPTIGF